MLIPRHLASWLQEVYKSTHFMGTSWIKVVCSGVKSKFLILGVPINSKILNSHENPALAAIMWNFSCESRIPFLHFLACAGSTWRCRRRATPWRSSLARTSSASSFNREIFACRVALEAWLHGLSTGTLKRNFVHETEPTNEKILYIVWLLYGPFHAESLAQIHPGLVF